MSAHPLPGEPGPLDKVYRPGPNRIFVFGSNRSGVHGAGAARAAYLHSGAVWGVGRGRQGMAYAIPTKSREMKTLPLSSIRESVAEFLSYAMENPHLSFFVTRIGCGLAGYTDADIAPMFKGAPENVELPNGW